MNESASLERICGLTKSGRLGVEALQRLLERRQPEEPVVLVLALELDQVDGALVAVHELGVGLEVGAAGAVPALVGAGVDVAVVVDPLHHPLHDLVVLGVGRADEEVVGHAQRGGQILEADVVAVAQLARRDALALGDLGHRLAVLVGAGEKEDVLASLAHVTGENVGRDRRVRVPQMGLRIHVVDRSRDVVRHGPKTLREGVFVAAGDRPRVNAAARGQAQAGERPAEVEAGAALRHPQASRLRGLRVRRALAGWGSAPLPRPRRPGAGLARRSRGRGACLRRRPERRGLEGLAIAEPARRAQEPGPGRVLQPGRGQALARERLRATRPGDRAAWTGAEPGPALSGSGSGAAAGPGLASVRGPERREEVHRVAVGVAAACLADPEVQVRSGGGAAARGPHRPQALVRLSS